MYCLWSPRWSSLSNSCITGTHVSSVCSLPAHPCFPHPALTRLRTGRVRASLQCFDQDQCKSESWSLLSPYPWQIPRPLQCDTDAIETIRQSFARITGWWAVLCETRHKDPPLRPADSPCTDGLLWFPLAKVTYSGTDCQWQKPHLLVWHTFGLCSQCCSCTELCFPWPCNASCTLLSQHCCHEQ